MRRLANGDHSSVVTPFLPLRNADPTGNTPTVLSIRASTLFITALGAPPRSSSTSSSTPTFETMARGNGRSRASQTSSGRRSARTSDGAPPTPRTAGGPRIPDSRADRSTGTPAEGTRSRGSVTAPGEPESDRVQAIEQIAAAQVGGNPTTQASALPTATAQGTDGTP